MIELAHTYDLEDLKSQATKQAQYLSFEAAMKMPRLLDVAVRYNLFKPKEIQSSRSNKKSSIEEEDSSRDIIEDSSSDSTSDISS